MKARAPVFVQSQYPLSMFGLPPFWLLLCLCLASVLTFCATLFAPDYKVVVFCGVLFGGVIFTKIKMGSDRHSDQVGLFSWGFRFKHRSGFIAVGGDDGQ